MLPVFEVEDIFQSELVKTFLKPGDYRPKNAPSNGNGAAQHDDEEEESASAANDKPASEPAASAVSCLPLGRLRRT